MQKEKVNSLADLYANTRNIDHFNELYREIIKEYKSTFAGTAKKLFSTVEDVQALYEDVLLRSLEHYQSGRDFVNFYNHNLRNAKIDLLAKHGRIYRFEMASENADGTSVFDTLSSDSVDVGYYKVRRERLMDTKKRELIQYLREKTKDTETKVIIDEFPKFPSLRTLAKSLGTSHIAVSRKLRRLARLHNEKMFGDYRMYIEA